jgi:hypothetical protein
MVRSAEPENVRFNEAPGEFVNFPKEPIDDLASWTTHDRVIMTPYFYWYDVWTQAHLLNPDHSDALTTHPATLTGFSYKSVQWHKSQLLDMEAAGIDVVLPVYWGDPSQLAEIGPSHWSYAGIPPLVVAREELLNEGKSPPLIGMFYDTTTLEHNVWNEKIDLTTPRGRAWYYESIRDYFSYVPSKHWAMIDHQPIIFTWVSSWAKAYDQSHVTESKRRFAEDFGGRPFYLVKEISWNIESDDVYAWGGAFGLRPLSVASLGPGYDHSNVPGRDPVIIDREDGAFFERNWIRLLRSGFNRVMIETWNEYHEGTDISHSLEYGRQYIDLNRQYADLFKERFVPPPVDGPYAESTKVDLDFAHPKIPEAIQWLDWSDGPSELVWNDDEACRRFKSDSDDVSYLYFRVHDSFRWAETLNLKLRVTAEVDRNAALDVQFDGSDAMAPFMGAYTSAPVALKIRVAPDVLTYEFDLKDARFLNSQNGGADFRLQKLRGSICIRSLELIKPLENGNNVSLGPGISIESISDTSLAIKVQGVSGTRYVVESSRNLNEWSPLSSLLIEDNRAVGELSVPIRWSMQYFRVRPAYQ